MASQIATTLTKVTSSLKALGLFTDVLTVEPKSPFGKGYAAAVFFASAAPATEVSSLTYASGLYVFTLRIYTDMLAEPAGQIDPKLIGVVDNVFDALLGDFDLGATVKNIDVFGQMGTPLRAEAGYVDVGGTMYRVVDITLPLVVNDTWALTR